MPVCASFDGLRSLCRLPCPLVLLPSLGPPTLSWRSLTPPVAGLVGRLPLTGRPSAPWPGVPPLQAPQSACPGPPQGPGALSIPGAPPCVPPGGVGRPLPGLGRSAPPRVVGVRRPMPLVAHGGLPCITLRLCAPSPPSSPGPRGSRSSLVLSHPRALAPYPGSPPLVRCRRPPLRRPGGKLCLPCFFRPPSGWRAGVLWAGSCVGLVLLFL